MKPSLFVFSLALTSPLLADGIVQNFETAPSDYWVWGKGRNSSGTAAISQEKAHSGATSTKVSFQFTGDGWIEFYTGQGAKIEGDVAYLSLWATGLKSDDFAASAVRFTDKNGETFQYELPELVGAATSPTWKEARAKIDLTQPKINWGGEADGILDKPIRFSGFGLTRKRAEAGAFFIDDLRVSDTELPTLTENVPGAVPQPEPTLAEAQPLAINNGSFSGGNGALQFSIGGAPVAAPDAATLADLLRAGKALDISSVGARWRVEPLAGWRDTLPLDAAPTTDSDSGGRLEPTASGARATLNFSATTGKNKYAQFPIAIPLPTDAESVGAIYKTDGPSPLSLAIRTTDKRREMMGFTLGNTTTPATHTLIKPDYRWGAPDSKTTTAPPQGQLTTFGLIIGPTGGKFVGQTQADIESLYVIRRVG